MKTDFDDDDNLIDEDDLIDEEEIPEIKPVHSHAWRDIEKKREEQALQKKLAKEFDLDGLEDDEDWNDG